MEYEGHDVRKEGRLDPKAVDQALRLPNGVLSENGLFDDAVRRFKGGELPPSKVRVYEKLRPGIWSDKGLFDLLDCAYVNAGGRNVLRFRMRLSPEVDTERAAVQDIPQTRIIPAWVKQEVYKRDKGRCVICAADDHLHFDHDLPYSRGGTSVLPENVRLLCARHNLQKGARIE
ncbi:MAG: HNH endonuclease [Dehalococcoidia bacterium]